MDMLDKKTISWHKGFDVGYKAAIKSAISSIKVVLNSFEGFLKPDYEPMRCDNVGCNTNEEHYKGLVIKGKWYCSICINNEQQTPRERDGI